VASVESWRTRLLRWRFNLIPAYRGTGARVMHVDRDFREIRIRLPLGWRTRNYVGTIFGGSMYGAVDPVYMMMLIQRLGRGYVVWDKAASIRFRKPGRTTLYARFRLEDEEVEAIRTALATQPTVDRVYVVELTDADGAVHATVEKTIHVRRREAPSQQPLPAR
jgi:acyl-coenzyme A thioesterase PaaI-like protein